MFSSSVDAFQTFRGDFGSAGFFEKVKAKAANFGYPGGLGIDTFIQFSKGYGLDINTSQAQTLKDTWFEAFPEMRSYMKEEEENVKDEAIGHS